MTDWIHCNKCFLRYHRRLKFYITTCGHTKCEKCISTLGTDKQCLVCNSTCEIVQLSNHLSPDIQNYFQPYSITAKNRKQIYTFQNNNVISLLKNVTGKYNAAKDELRKQQKMTEGIKKENAKLEIMLGGSTRREFVASSTPGGHIFNMSMGVTPIPRFPKTNNPPRYNQQRYPVPVFGGTQNTTSITPRMSSREVNTPRNPAMIPFSQLQLGSKNNGR